MNAGKPLHISLDPSAPKPKSLNFEFLTDSTARRWGRRAEQSFCLDPGYCLGDMRNFGEHIAKEAMAVHKVVLSERATQKERMTALRSNIDSAAFNLLDDLRKLGNPAVHGENYTQKNAVQALRTGLHLGLWYQSYVLGIRVTTRKFQKPQCPDSEKTTELQRQLNKLIQDKQDEEVVKSSFEKRIALLEEELKIALDMGQESEEGKIAIQRAFDQLLVARKEEAIARTLQEAGITDDDKGVPLVAIAIAQGESPPKGVVIPDEVIEDIVALEDLTALPSSAPPNITLKNKGNLGAASAKRFIITPSITSGPNNDTVSMAKNFEAWQDHNGHVFIMPPRLAVALQDLQNGPPEQENNQSVKEWSIARRLWWGQLRRELAPFDVKLSRYLASQDAQVIDKLIAEPRIGEDGEIELTVRTSDISADDLTKHVDGLHAIGTETTVHTINENGHTNRRTLLLSPQARKAVATTKSLRRNRKKWAAQLADAPASLLDNDLFDLSNYSDRVVGIGKAVYRVSSFVPTSGDGGSHFKLSQTAGLKADNVDSVAANLTPQETAELATLLSTAAAKGIFYVEFKGGWVRVPGPSIVESMAAVPQSTASGDLLIKENIDTMAYSADDWGAGQLVKALPRPPGLASKYNLLRHQELGLAWLAGHSLLGTRSSNHGMLADDMGLGKTIQVLSLMSMLLERNELNPCLVVAPVSLLQNWCSEADKFFPSRFKNRIVLGPGQRPKTDALKSYDVVFASYETIRSQSMELGRVRWQLMVCDESHRIKNPTAQTTKAIYAMDAKIRIALSGTPVQNSLRDLWSQFDWLSSGFLGDLTSFTKRYEGRKIVGQPEERNRRLTALKEQINPRVLRRLKETTDGLDIPPKHIEKIELPLNERQVSLYNQIHTDFRRGDIQSMSAMMSLFKVCASPSTLTGLQVDASDLGPKMNWLVKKVLEIKSKGEKVVIFAEWYTVQDAIATVLSQALGEFVDRINGKVETALRLAKVDSFNRGTHGTVLVLGPKAAGVGLNITGANHVIHFTRHWNPALEAQATDRVHRIGQKRDVTVYLPVMTHPHLKTIELHLDALLQAKQGLAKDILMGVEQMSVQTQLERAMEAEPSSL